MSLVPPGEAKTSFVLEVDEARVSGGKIRRPTTRPHPRSPRRSTRGRDDPGLQYRSRETRGRRADGPVRRGGDAPTSHPVSVAAERISLVAEGLSTAEGSRGTASLQLRLGRSERCPRPAEWA